MTYIKLITLVLISTWLVIIGYDNSHPFAKTPLCANHYTIVSTPDVFADGTSSEDGLVDTRQQWAQLEKTILNSPDKTIFIIDNGRGGLTSMGQAFVATILKAKQEGHVIIFDVTKSVASMHAFILFYGDKVILEKGAYALFHAPYARLQNGQKDYSFNPNVPQDRNIMNFMENVYTTGLDKGLITIDDMKTIQIEHKALIYHRNNNNELEETVVEDEK